MTNDMLSYAPVSSMQISIRINTEAFTRWRERVEAAMTPVTTPGPMQDGLLRMSNAYHASMRLRYAEASTGTGIWEPLKPATVASHAKAGEPIPSILRQTGRLEESLSRGDPAHVLEITDNGIIEGTEDPKATYHQNGGTNGDNPPKREILVEPDQQTLDAIKSALVGGVSAVVHGESGPLVATDSELEAIFGIDII